MKILCVGSNYQHHVREMGGKPPAAPVWFWKPESAIVHDGDAVVLPAGVGAVHHEVELAVRLGRTVRRADEAAAAAAIDGFTVAVDVTARDLQARAKAEGRPWTQAKGYDTFLPLGAWQDPVDLAVDLLELRLRLRVDDEVRQEARTAAMTWAPAALVAQASQWTTLVAGDVLLTGTPAGVGPLASGQTMVAEVVGHVTLRNPVTAA